MSGKALVDAGLLREAEVLFANTDEILIAAFQVLKIQQQDESTGTQLLKALGAKTFLAQEAPQPRLLILTVRRRTTSTTTTSTHRSAATTSASSGSTAGGFKPTLHICRTADGTEPNSLAYDAPTIKPSSSTYLATTSRGGGGGARDGPAANLPPAADMKSYPLKNLTDIVVLGGSSNTTTATATAPTTSSKYEQQQQQRYGTSSSNPHGSSSGSHSHHHAPLLELRFSGGGAGGGGGGGGGAGGGGGGGASYRQRGGGDGQQQAGAAVVNVFRLQSGEERLLLLALLTSLASCCPGCRAPRLAGVEAGEVQSWWAGRRAALLPALGPFATGLLMPGGGSEDPDAPSSAPSRAVLLSGKEERLLGELMEAFE
ncbi:hypothetical protein Agub_g6635, partial [Astrephomene gubernaculifera]